MSVVAIPREQYGTFYDTDSYVIFAASLYGQPVGVDSVVSKTLPEISRLTNHSRLEKSEALLSNTTSTFGWAPLQPRTNPALRLTKP